MKIGFKNVQIHLAGTGAIAVCTLCAYLLGARPVFEAEEQLRQIVIEQEHLHGLLPTMHREIAALQNDIEAKQQQIKKNYTIATQSEQPLIGTVSRLLTSRRIELSNLREETSKIPGEVTILLQVTSEYADMLSFINDLRRLDRPARINFLNLTANDDSGQRCSARMSIKFSPPIDAHSPPNSTVASSK